MIASTLVILNTLSTQSPENKRPIAAFSCPSTGYVNEVIIFNASLSSDPDGTIISYLWDFGDESNGTGKVVTHAYTAPGIFKVSLIVVDDKSLSSAPSNSSIEILSSAVNSPPVAVISSPAPGEHDTFTISFDGRSSYDPDGDIIDWHRDFGDGTFGYGKTIAHVYNFHGTYGVTLTVSDDGSATDSDSKSVRVLLNMSTPVAKIICPKVGITGQSVQLSGAMSFSFVGLSIVNYSWDLGDGCLLLSELPTVSHSWVSPGSYQVSLTVKDSNGSWSIPAYHTIAIVNSAPSGIGVSLSKHSLQPLEVADLTIKIVDAVGNVVNGMNCWVDLICNQTSGVSLPSHAVITNGVGQVQVSFANPRSYLIAASNSSLGISGKELATVATRTVEIRFYDIFERAPPDYWIIRSLYYSLMDEIFRDTTPVVIISRTGFDYRAGQLSTVYRLSLEGRNVPEIRTTNPTFVPRMNPSGGTTGNISYHLTWHYMTLQELIDARNEGKITQAQFNSRDGWEYYLVGNLTMDRKAAAHIIGLPISETDVQAWFAMQDFYAAWCEDWWFNESSDFFGNSGRLDIRASDDGYPLHQGFWNTEFESLTEDPVSGNVTLNFWRIGYGEDILIMRQLYWGGESYGAVYPNGTPYGILPFECWLEDFNMTLKINETSADVNLDCAVAYGWRAWKSDTAPAGVASWRWENIRSDYMEVVPPVVKSEMDLWSSRGLKYTSWDAGSSAFGKNISYDYAPNVWNMVLGEVLVIKKPTLATPIGYLPYPMIGNYSQVDPVKAGYYESLLLIEIYGDATLHAIGCPPGTAIIDSATGDLKIAGPFEPLKVMTPGIPWLIYEPAPRIEIWVK
ncbi:MAG: PKD domain-containing protein [Thermoplasmata archaeon]